MATNQLEVVASSNINAAEMQFADLATHAHLNNRIARRWYFHERHASLSELECTLSC